MHETRIHGSIDQYHISMYHQQSLVIIIREEI